LEVIAAPGTKRRANPSRCRQPCLAIDAHIIPYFPPESANVSNWLWVMRARPDCGQAFDLKDFSEIRRRMPEKILFSRIEAMQRKSP
jgi:hypothetical protein